LKPQADAHENSDYLKVERNTMAYNPAIHHRRSIRIQGFDYSGKGNYFITICCEQRRHLFGKIVDGQMQLNQAGESARKCWLAIPDHFPHVTLEEFVIMPDHVHGVLCILTDGNDNPENFQLKNEPQKMLPRSIGSAGF
jgi:putative transposase